MLRQQLYGANLDENNEDDDATQIEIENNLSDTSEDDGSEDASMSVSTLNNNNQTLNSLDLKARKLIEKRFESLNFKIFHLFAFCI
jgi:hypothetical protein